MTIYRLFDLTHKNFKIDVLRKEIVDLTGQCNMEAQVKQMSLEVPDIPNQICYLGINLMKHSHRMMANSKLYCVFSDSEPPSWEAFIAYGTLVFFCNQSICPSLIFFWFFP